MNRKKNIAVLTCWYGNYPWYFPYFLHSCSFNSSIDFLIFTDNQETIANKPNNVKIIFKTIDTIKKTTSEKLGFEVNIDYPYKLCDFKPAYGLIFSEYLKNYDFWGHGDIDIIYGNIRNFITNDLLQDYDVISSRHDYITGSFCLFKNTEKINRLFLKSRDYELVFSSSEHFCFDECNFLFAELSKGFSIFDFPNHIQSMTYVVKKEEEKGHIKCHFDFLIIEGTPGKIEFNNGHIIYKNQFEAMYYHLIKFKNDCKNQNILKPIPNLYYITTKNIKA